jgi:predicted O-methyltransferase YrrM
MVELGTRGGESTRALLAAASINQSTLLSVDIEDCRQDRLPFAEHWQFIQADDVVFGRERFADWGRQHGMPEKAKLIFIDTSHEYEHTKQEIAAWAPHLADRGILLFHDTNMGNGKFARMDGSISLGWDNQRGVIRAIEEFLGRQYDENSFFTDIASGYLVQHYPHCNGLTVLKRLN